MSPARGKPALSVIVRAKDEEASIERALQLVRDQHLTRHDLELIVVDSGSSDRTADIARAYDARLVAIPAERFTFGGALNTGCRLATGELLVSLSAHAFPTDLHWLQRMVSIFDDERVCCASGEGRGPDGALLSGSVHQDIELARVNPSWGFSNSAGAFRAALWRTHEFRADLPGSEDKAWAWHWLERGYVTVISEDLQVEHDHNLDPLRDHYRRARREAQGIGAFLELPPQTWRDVLRRWWSERGTYDSIWRARLSHRRTARLFGAYRGSRRAAALRPRGVSSQAAERKLGLLVDRFPELSETFIRAELEALRGTGIDVSVEARSRPSSDRRATVPADLAVHWLEDETVPTKLVALAWLWARHPLACAADFSTRRHFSPEEVVTPFRALAPRARRLSGAGASHLHVHFAGPSAQDALRISRLLGVPYSVMPHAFDIYSEPRNLLTKLVNAAFVAGPCDYTVAHLREIVGARAQDRVHKVVMGVDGDRWRRRSPHPSGKTVVGIGRLVEKKGFDVLLDAIALVQAETPLDRVVIVGSGPQGKALQAQVETLGLTSLVELPGACGPEEIQELLESADLLAMPSVIAMDGDRDAAPVVVKEALAMEVPVVASDEVGLPEVVRPRWGRLVPPGDAPALAAGISELLALPPAERAEMGAVGRAWVLEHENPRRQAAALIALIGGVDGPAIA